MCCCAVQWALYQAMGSQLSSLPDMGSAPSSGYGTASDAVCACALTCVCVILAENRAKQQENNGKLIDHMITGLPLTYSLSIDCVVIVISHHVVNKNKSSYAFSTVMPGGSSWFGICSEIRSVFSITVTHNAAWWQCDKLSGDIPLC